MEQSRKYVMTTALTAIVLALGIFSIPSQAFAATSSDFTASDVTTKTTFKQPVGVQLVGNGNSTFTYEIVAQPAHGAITGFNNATGALTYTPDGQIAFAADSFQYRVVDSSNSTNTSDNATVTVNVEGESHHFYVIAEGFANAYPEFNHNAKAIPESHDATANSVQFGQYGTNLFDVLHYLDLQGLGRNQITDGQFVWLMENIF